MTPILLPQDLENAITEEARRRGMAPETLAVDGLRRLFAPGEPSGPHADQGCLLDFLAGYTGSIDGTSEAFSEECGSRFTDAVADKRDGGCL